MGSKLRVSKEIIPLIIKNRKENQYFVDIFCGGGSIIEKIQGPRIANDINKYVIACLEEVSKGWIPPQHVTEEHYNQIKNNIDKYSPELVGFVGICCSFGAKFFGGYARRSKDGSKVFNYALAGSNNLLKQAPNLKGIEFHSVDYRELEIPPSSIIYCDIPYKGTTKYKNKFDYTEFWKWANNKVRDNNQVFVSEYIAPPDWVSIWSREINSSFDHDRINKARKTGSENLFIHQSRIN